MKVTRTWIATNFDTFNKEYFNGKLPIPNFLLCNTYRMLGQCGAKNWRSAQPNFYIKISNYFERTEHEFKTTLLHEMIHLYFQSKADWKEGHGRKFQAMARTFDKYGYDIHTKSNLTHKTTNHTIPTRVVMTFKEKSNNNIWVCCVANDPIKMGAFKRTIDNSTTYIEPQFWTTNNEMFSGMKISHKRLGGKIVTEKVFNETYIPLLVKFNRIW